MAETARGIARVPLADLVPDAANPKSHDIDLIKDSVARFGFIEPIVRDDRTGKIVGGHGRAETLRGMEQRGDHLPAGIELDDHGSWLVPVVVGWSSRDDTEAHAAMIALNRTTELGGWDDQPLLDLLNELTASDEGLAGIGFAAEDVDDLARAMAQPAAENAGYVKDDVSYEGFLERYAERATRSIVLHYPLPRFQWVLDRLGEMRQQWGTETNAATILRLLAEHSHQQPPEVEEVEEAAS